MENERETPEIFDLYERWKERTAVLSSERSPVPLAALLGDAVDLAAFIETHYEPVSLGDGEVPGLRSVEPKVSVNLETARELRELQRVISYSNAEATTRLEARSADPLVRSREILTDLRAGLDLAIEDERSGDRLALEQLRRETHTRAAHDQVAVVLERFAALGARYASDLEALGIPRARLKEAIEMAHALRDRSAERIRQRAAREGREFLLARNRFIAALNERLRHVRRVIRFVYREHPELAKQATSAYYRARSASGDQSEPELDVTDALGTDEESASRSPRAAA